MPPKKSARAAKTGKNTSPRSKAAPRTTRSAPATIEPTSELADGEDDVDSMGADGEGDSAGEDDDAPPATASPRDAAAGRIGHSIHAHLEALYMTDPDGAIEAISTIVPVAAELAQIGGDLEVLGATDLARDVRLAVDRMQRTPR